MKKLLLPAMLSTALFGLTACGDDDKAVAEKVVTETVAAAEPAPVVEVDNATAAEEMFKKMTTGSEAYYQTLLNVHPLIKSISYELVSYTKGEGSSTATTKGTVTLNTEIEGKSSFDLMLDHTIMHDDATTGKGLVASIQSTIQKPIESEPELVQLIENISSTTDVKKDLSFSQLLTVKPIEVTEEDNKVMFGGLDITTESNLENISGGFGIYSIDFKGFSVDIHGDMFKFEPVSFNMDYQPSGDFTFKSNAPIIAGDGTTQFEIAEVTGKGNIQRNEKHNVMLGTQNYQINSITVTTPDLPMPLQLDSLTIATVADIDGSDILSQAVDLSLTPAAGLTSTLSQGMLDISKADISFALNNVPAGVMTQYQTMMQDVFGQVDSDDSTEADAKFEADAQAMFDSIKAQGSDVGFDINLTTAQGPVSLDSTFKVLSDSPLTFADLESIQSPAQIFGLLSVNADVSIPAALYDQTPLAFFAGPFFTQEGDAYKAKAVTEAGQLLINGIPAPL